MNGVNVFDLVRGTVKGMEGDFGHLYKIEKGKTIEFNILDDLQKLAAIIKAVNPAR